jgi:hypothetical protein
MLMLTIYLQDEALAVNLGTCPTTVTKTTSCGCAVATFLPHSQAVPGCFHQSCFGAFQNFISLFSLLRFVRP